MRRDRFRVTWYLGMVGGGPCWRVGEVIAVDYRFLVLGRRSYGEEFVGDMCLRGAWLLFGLEELN